MDFNFTAEQEMLRDSVARYFGDHYAFSQRQAVIRSVEGWRPGFWRGLADDVGILGAPFDEAMGGLGGGAVETMIVMEEIGKTLVIEPYLDSVVIGGGLLRRCGTARARELIGASLPARSGWPSRIWSRRAASISRTSRRLRFGTAVRGASTD